MSANATVMTDQSLLSRLDRLFYRLESLLSLLGGCVIMGLVALAVTNVLGRWIFNWPVNGYIDWVEQSMAFMAFMGLSFTQRDGGHIRMDMLIAKLHGRALWAVELLSTVVMFVLTLLLCWGSWIHFKRALDLGDSSIDIGLPTWPAKLVVPVAMAILAIRLLLQIWGYGRALYRGDTHPVAVPLIEDAAAHAAREAAAMELDEEADTNSRSAVCGK